MVMVKQYVYILVASNFIGCSKLFFDAEQLRLLE